MVESAKEKHKAIVAGTFKELVQKDLIKKVAPLQVGVCVDIHGLYYLQRS